ncbi:hypothetical protein [Bryocella elongata]|uniref:hypothetical protein n=1 Tax=Bryocella elongata TaxID=863522 RepID=UPI000CDF157E|nr:hypothetical protein [Bryocella elongata]
MRKGNSVVAAPPALQPSAERKRLRRGLFGPVKTGPFRVVAGPEEWAWSSFRQWWGGEVGVVEVEYPALARRRGGLGEKLGPDGRVRKIPESE